MLGVSTDSVERLLAGGYLRRVEGLRSVRITVASIATYAGLPVREVLFAAGGGRVCRRRPDSRRTGVDVRLLVVLGLLGLLLAAGLAHCGNL